MRVTFWAAPGSAALLVEHAGEKLCHVTQHPDDDPRADDALAAFAAGADLLIFPGDWETGLRLKHRAGIKLLALTCRNDHCERLAEAAAEKSANVFFARPKMRLEL